MAACNTALDALAPLRSGMNIFLHGTSATPTPLLDALVQREDLHNITIYHLHLCGEVPFAEERFAGRFRSVSLFTGPALRKPIEEGRADYVPIFLSDIPHLIRSGNLKLDAMLLQLSPPDRHGHCTLGTAVEVARAGADTAPILIAEINEQMPRTHGDTILPLSRLTSYFRHSRPMHETEQKEETEVEARIGEHIAELVEDGSCLQMGIGGIPDAVLARLKNKQHLGIHTEMFSDRLIDLVQSGAVTNRRKAVYSHRIVTSFVVGTQRLFDFVHDNAMVEFHPCDHTNDTALIRKIEKMVAINSALQVDLSGQVCADSLGHRIYSGIGGQVDFIRGATFSKGGKPIIALPATAKGGTISRIVPELSPGAGVVTSRGHVHWVVTEFGAVNLHGLSLRQRGAALISIAAPQFREELRAQLQAVRHFILP
ncbi:MAG TPA: acetyl-CoA hydrolase/transferase C-terminal domain-containing protein [Gemmatales bacterium]|nr:acetyl-CoA hydrolase/transferase C-terminal domain-containing protein [Gemmatales bacterium]